MSGEQFSKSYQLMEPELALFNEEHYVSVWKVSLAEIDEADREALFDTLFAFESPDVEVQVDVSEERNGLWYLQLLTPYLFSTVDLAKKRIQRGGEALRAYLAEQMITLDASLLLDEQIYHYLKRYNPEIA